MQRATERVLVVPFADGIGDFVMLLPLLAAVRRRYPLAAITVSASQRAALLLDEAQEAVFWIRTPRWLRDRATPRGGPLRRVIPQTTLALAAGIALRLELGPFDRTLNLFQWWEQGIDFRRYWTPQVPPRAGAVHTVDFLAERLGRELGQPLPPAARRPQVRLRQAAAAWAADWWGGAGLGRRPVIALVPATNMAIKRWSVASWRRLGQALTVAGYAPLLVLPPGADPVEAALRRVSPPPVAVRASLDRVAALLARCQLVVGVDTGLIHVAAAVGTPYVGLFSPTNPLVTGPYDRSLGTTLVAPVEKTPSCGSCWRQFKYIDDRCRTLRTGSCMSGLTVEAVLQACHAGLARSAARAESCPAGDQALLDRDPTWESP